MRWKRVVSILIVLAFLSLLGTGFQGKVENYTIIGMAKGVKPDDGVDGYQSLTGDWVVTGYEEYANETIALSGNLYVQSGGHLVLHNCTLMMMSTSLQTYEIGVFANATLELYDCYITDTPTDDDTEFLSSYYYFYAKNGSTLVIEGSVIRQCGFMDFTNLDHMGLSIGTYKGHIQNTVINTSAFGATFHNYNKGFWVENITVADTNWYAIYLLNSEGLVLRGVHFHNMVNGGDIDIEGSSDFLLEDTWDLDNGSIYIEDSSGFLIRNVTNNNSMDTIDISHSSDFEVFNLTCNTTNYYNFLTLSDCSYGVVRNITGKDKFSLVNVFSGRDIQIHDIQCTNVSNALKILNSENITVSGGDFTMGWNPISITSSNNVHVNDIRTNNTSQPIHLDTCAGTYLTALTLLDTRDVGIYATGDATSSLFLRNVSILGSNSTNPKGISCDGGAIFMENMNLSHLDTGMYLKSTVSSIDASIMDTYINGEGVGTKGVEFDSGNILQISNLTVDNMAGPGITIKDTMGENVSISDISIRNTNKGIDASNSRAAVTSLSCENVSYDVYLSQNSNVTVMNSTLNNIYLWDSDMVMINSTNNTVTFGSGSEHLIQKWWVDVYVNDSAGPVAGAVVVIYDKDYNPDGTGVTGLDGFARGIAVTENIYTGGGGVDERNPHTAAAGGPGWNFINSTSYKVDHNMRVNVTYPWNTPPNSPGAIVAYSDENSNTHLVWAPSTSQDVDHYEIYMARSLEQLTLALSSGQPNTTTNQCEYIHLGGSGDWREYWYAVKANDTENDSAEAPWGRCGDWVVNSTVPQGVSNGDIFLNGTLKVYGTITMTDVNIQINSSTSYTNGIFINGSGTLMWENVTLRRASNDAYYYFAAFTDAYVYINDSIIDRPGLDVTDPNPTKLGMYVATGLFFITNTSIIVNYTGLTLSGIPDFRGRVYNVNFTSYLYTEWGTTKTNANVLLMASYTKNPRIEKCTFDNAATNAIYMEGVENATVRGTRIRPLFITRSSSSKQIGVYLSHCLNAHIHDNPLLFGDIGVFVQQSDYTTIVNNSLSSEYGTGIYVNASTNTKVDNCRFEETSDKPGIGIKVVWSQGTAITNLTTTEINRPIIVDNGTDGYIYNISIYNGECGISLTNSHNIVVSNVSLGFIYSGAEIIASTDIYLTNVTINLTMVGMSIQSQGPIYIINCTLMNGLMAEVSAEGYLNGVGEVYMFNSTIYSFTNHSVMLNNSAVLTLINTSFDINNTEFLDAASRVEAFHIVSIQAHDIKGQTPPWAEIKVNDATGLFVLDVNYTNGLVDFCILHEKTVFRGGVFNYTPYTFWVFDGHHSGTMTIDIRSSQHVDLYVDNELPEVDYIDLYGYSDNGTSDPWDDIVSDTPTTDMDLRLEYGYSDPEGDSESGTIIHWYVNGIYNSSFDGLTIIDHNCTEKYQTWQAVIYPCDGYDSTYPLFPFESDVIYIENTPPVVRNVSITPAEPNGGDTLKVIYEFYDVDGDGPDAMRTSHKWYYYDEVAGEWVYSNVDSESLDPLYTHKGDLWACAVIPSDGDESGDEVWSNPVWIGNGPPSISNARIVPLNGGKGVTSMDNLTVIYEFHDPDGDNENGTEVVWYLMDDGNWTEVYEGHILPYNLTAKGDVWSAFIIPMDGEDEGEGVWAENVTIDNTPPLVRNVSINVSEPESSMPIGVTYDYYDYDGDSENGTSYRWIYEDTFGPHDSGITGRSVPSGIILKGQTWYCIVTPSDGTNLGMSVKSPGVRVVNAPPVITAARLEYFDSGGKRWISVNYSHGVRDVDDLTYTDTEVRWFLNGSEVIELRGNTSIPGRYLHKGQVWYCMLRVSDGDSWGEWYTTEDITVPNTPPVLTHNPSLTPPKPSSNMDLQPLYVEYYYDLDGDPLVDVDVRWYRDNGLMIDYSGLTLLPAEYTHEGEVWYCEVRVSDGDSWGEWYSSNPVLIRNTPPAITYLTPINNTVSVLETESIVLSVNATDVDNEKLMYQWYLDGRIVLYEEGVNNSIYIMKTDYDSAGSYNLRLVISDGRDITEVTWSITVLNKNRLPLLTVLQPEGRNATISETESIEFVITKSDADGDILGTRWYLDGHLVKDGGDKYTYTPDYYSGGRSHKVMVEVYEVESGANVTYTWTIDVKDVPQVIDTFYGLTWDQWGILMEVVLTIVSGIVALWGIMKLRKKKGKLKEYMMEIDSILGNEHMEPEAKEKDLVDLKSKVKDEFSQGLIEDNHYIIIEREVDDALGEVRRDIVKGKVRMGRGVEEEVEKVLEDGIVTREEYMSLMSKVLASPELDARDKIKLKTLMGRWMEEDKESGEGDVMAGGDSEEEVDMGMEAEDWEGDMGGDG